MSPESLMFGSGAWLKVWACSRIWRDVSSFQLLFPSPLLAATGPARFRHADSATEPASHGLHALKHEPEKSCNPLIAGVGAFCCRNKKATNTEPWQILNR